MATPCPGYDNPPHLRIVAESERKLIADDEAGEAYEDIDYGATDEETFRGMMACFSPLTSVDMEHWVAIYNSFVVNCPGSPFHFNAPFSGEGEFRAFDVVDDSPPSPAHPSRFQLLWEDCRGECVGNGIAALFVHSDVGVLPPTLLVIGSWADSIPKWTASSTSYEPLVDAIRLALLRANLEFGFQDLEFQMRTMNVREGVNNN
jgi:hypothetical protein